MRVLNCSHEDLRDAALESDVELYNVHCLTRTHRTHRLTLRPLWPQALRKWQRVSPRGRKVHAVCWHGHLAFMRSLYKRNPEAKIRTAQMDYNSAQDLEAQKMESYHTNIGSVAFPSKYGEACDC
jgi:hypothetical protein